MFLGLDISKLSFDAVLLDGPDALTSGKPRHRAFPNTEAGFERLAGWLEGRRVHACLEATGPYGDALARSLHALARSLHALARSLHARGHTASVVNPARVRAFGQSRLARAKTDKADAALTARYCALHRPPAWAPPAPELAELQALVRRLESLTEMRQMERDRLDVTDAAAVRASLGAVLSVLDEQVRATESLTREHIGRHPGLRGRRDLLTSIPGVAERTAAAILAELGGVAQFAGARQAAAFAGLVPRIRQSGTSGRGRACLSKAGSARLRRALYMPAVAALRCNPAIRALRERLLASGKPKMLVLGAAMRELLQIAFGVLKSGKPFDQSICMAAPAGA